MRASKALPEMKMESAGSHNHPQENDDISPLVEIISRRFPWLFTELGFRIVSVEDKPEIMGYSYLSLRCPTFSISFERDRGIICTTLASLEIQAPLWVFEDLLAYLENRPLEDRNQSGMDLDLNAIALDIRTHFKKISELLGPESSRTNVEMSRLVAQRTENYFRKTGIIPAHLAYAAYVRPKALR
jgi:hypothetical protein